MKTKKQKPAKNPNRKVQWLSESCNAYEDVADKHKKRESEKARQIPLNRIESGEEFAQMKRDGDRFRNASTEEFMRD